MKQPIAQLLEFISQFDRGGKFILGIDGLSRSGKTSLVNQLLQESSLQTIVLHIDDYIVSRDKRYQTGYEEWYEYYNLQWDVKSLQEDLFNKLKADKRLELLRYDEERDNHHIQLITLPSNCLIIIEGVFLQRKEWRSFFDYTIYLDCPRDTRFLRESEVTQKNREKFENRYWKAEDHYLNEVNPIQRADLVIPC